MGHSKPVRLGNRTIGVNLGTFGEVLATININMLKKHPSKNPLQGLGNCGSAFL